VGGEISLLSYGGFSRYLCGRKEAVEGKEESRKTHCAEEMFMPEAYV
jgi:hypothetical protein